MVDSGRQRLDRFALRLIYFLSYRFSKVIARSRLTSLLTPTGIFSDGAAMANISMAFHPTHHTNEAGLERHAVDDCPLSVGKTRARLIKSSSIENKEEKPVA